MSRYVQDPNNPNKQIPGPLPDNAYDRSSTPGSGSYTKSPNYVVIGDTITGDIGFYFGSSASFAALEGGSGNPITGSSHYTFFGTPTAGTRLDIHPSAWSGSDTNGGKVIFVYKSGLSTGGR